VQAPAFSVLAARARCVPPRHASRRHDDATVVLLLVRRAISLNEYTSFVLSILLNNDWFRIFHDNYPFSPFRNGIASVCVDSLRRAKFGL
jgi:hypothetical protein